MGKKKKSKAKLEDDMIRAESPLTEERYLDVPEAYRSPAMTQMKTWIERQYGGDDKVEAATHPLSVDEILEQQTSGMQSAEEYAEKIQSTRRAATWHAAMRHQGFDIGKDIPGEVKFGVNDQPAPKGNDNVSVHDLVAEDIEQRKQFGLEKYGTILQAGNGRKSLKDAYEEILDLACYLRCAIVEQEEALQRDSTPSQTDR